jgi:hypothetical protein
VCLRRAERFSFCPTRRRGLGFRRVRPRILEAARASEIGGGDGYRRSTDVRRARLRLGNTGFRSPGFVRRRWPMFAGSNPSINTHSVQTYKPYKYSMRKRRHAVSYAKRGLAIVRKVREAGQAYIRNGHTVHLGPCSIDRSEPDGTAKAGCRVVSWEEIERSAPYLESLPSVPSQTLRSCGWPATMVSMQGIALRYV